jgi:hypothetical protein
MAALAEQQREYGLLNPIGNPPGVNGGGESPFTKGARLSVAYGVGNDPGAPITTGPSIPAEPLILVTPSPIAGKIPVPHFI